MGGLRRHAAEAFRRARCQRKAAEAKVVFRVKVALVSSEAILLRGDQVRDFSAHALVTDKVRVLS